MAQVLHPKANPIHKRRTFQTFLINSAKRHWLRTNHPFSPLSRTSSTSSAHPPLPHSPKFNNTLSQN